MNKEVKIIVVILILLTIVILTVFILYVIAGYNSIDYADLEFENFTQKAYGLNCYNKIEYIDCYISPSTTEDNITCLACSDILYFYRCYNNNCTLIEQYRKL